MSRTKLPWLVLSIAEMKEFLNPSKKLLSFAAREKLKGESRY